MSAAHLHARRALEEARARSWRIDLDDHGLVLTALVESLSPALVERLKEHRDAVAAVLAADMVKDCIKKGCTFPDALAAFLADSCSDASGNPLEPADRAKMLEFYHRLGRLSDAQRQRALADHPELSGACR